MNTYTFRLHSDSGMVADVMVHAANLAIASEAVKGCYKSYWIEEEPVSIEHNTDGKYCQGVFCD